MTTIQNFFTKNKTVDLEMSTSVLDQSQISVRYQTFLDTKNPDKLFEYKHMGDLTQLGLEAKKINNGKSLGNLNKYNPLPEQMSINK